MNFIVAALLICLYPLNDKDTINCNIFFINVAFNNFINFNYFILEGYCIMDTKYEENIF